MYKTIQYLTLLLWGWATVDVHLYAQGSTPPPGFRFEVFELPGGELGNHVQSIAQDSFGFMWFGSQYGLHRWDGYQFKTYLNNALDPASISSNYVEFIFVAKDGTLWLGTWGGGLNHFDPATQQFTHYLHDPRNPESISNNYISEIVQDRDGYLWIATQYGLNRLDPATGRFKRFLNDPRDPGSLSYDKVRALCLDTDGVLWIGTGWPWEGSRAGGLNRYIPETGKFTRYLHDPADPNSLANNKVQEIYEDSKGNLWIGTGGDGLHRMDKKTGKFVRLSNRNGDETALSAPFIFPSAELHTKFIFEDQQQKLWIGSWLGGIKYYDPATKCSIHFKAGAPGGESVPDDNAWAMFQSADGTRWSCTAGPGGQVFKIVEERKVFATVGLYPEDAAQAFCESRSGALWVGTRNMGLLRFDPATKSAIRYRDNPHRSICFQEDEETDRFKGGKTQLFDNIWKIVEDKSGALWMGKWLQGDGLYRFNPSTGDLKVYRHDPKKPNSLVSNTIMDILQDGKGRLWIATADGQLNRYDPETDGFTRFPVIGNRGSRVANTAKEFFFSKLTLARDGTLWIGGSGGDKANIPLTLAHFDPETESFRPHDLRLNPYEPGSPEWVNGLEEDKEGNIWINTEFTLRKVNPHTGINTTYGAVHLGTPVLRGMVIDDSGRLWLSGDGLIVFNPADGTSFTYHGSSGVRTMPFVRQAALKGANGYIFFGGNSGFQLFRPAEIGNAPPAKAPGVLITDFKIFDESVTPGEKGPLDINIWTTSEIHLEHDQNVFSFRFAALDFLFPEGNRHKFMLEGYDQDWRLAGLEPVVSYVKVPPGTYTFRVRAANRNGVWGPEKSILVIIYPPWWASWWAYGLYTALALAILYAFYRVQLKRKLEQAEALRLRELDAIKTKLYTNITHEFRTPLTVISGMSQHIRENPTSRLDEGLDMIDRNCTRLLTLVNQMLDLAKLESGKMTLHLQQGDVVRYLKYLVESFHSFAESRGVQLHFLADLDSLMMDYDPERLQQVVGNLLSNAVKFTPAGGQVYVDLRLEKEKASPGSPWRRSALAPRPDLVIRVRDTSIGIPEAQLPHIFDRFYQVDDTHTRQRDGSGIGLALTKELVHLMQGAIQVKSQTGKGTAFMVSLPVHTEAKPAENEPVIHLLTPLPPPTHQPNNHSTSQPINQSTNQPINQSTKTTILLAEDNPDVVAYLAACLPDYRLLVGKDGQEAIDIALEHIPDLVVTDVMMPHKDGFDVCRTIRHDERTSHIPIIMLTAKADQDSLLEGLEHGADAYLAKPFHKEELLLRIRKLLEQRRLLRRHYLAIAGLSNGVGGVKEIPPVPEMEDQFVKKVRCVVEAQLDNPGFDVEQLCRTMAMSHSQLHRKLSALTGYPATRFIRLVRLNKAKELLQNPALSISAIAFDTGFNDPSYFGRVFRQEVGMSPQEWRERVAMQAVSDSVNMGGEGKGLKRSLGLRN